MLLESKIHLRPKVVAVVEQAVEIGLLGVAGMFWAAQRVRTGLKAWPAAAFLALLPDSIDRTVGAVIGAPQAGGQAERAEPAQAHARGFGVGAGFQNRVGDVDEQRGVIGRVAERGAELGRDGGGVERVGHGGSKARRARAG